LSTSSLDAAFERFEWCGCEFGRGVAGPRFVDQLGQTRNPARVLDRVSVLVAGRAGLRG
jgi:hypothetical protein